MLVEKFKHTSLNIFSVITYFLAIIACVIIVPAQNTLTMFFYIVVMSLSLIFAFISEFAVNKQVSQACYWISIAILGSLMAFRAQTAIDDWTYGDIFYRARNTGLFAYLSQITTEKGYSLLNWFLFHITKGNYNIAQAIIAYGSIAMWGKAILSIKKLCSVPVAILLIWTHYYFVVLGAGLVRIFIALPIVLYALHFFWEGNLRAYIICVLIASLFHMSALIMLVLILFCNNKKWFYENWVIVVIALLYMVPAAFIIVSKFLVPLLGQRYAAYGVLGSFSLSIGSFDTLPILLIGLYYLKAIPQKNREAFIVGLVLISLSMIFSLFSSMVDLGRWHCQELCAKKEWAAD